MNAPRNALLLPSGLYDLLPPDAARESALVGALLAHFRACGYEQVHPPLMEYDETLHPETKAFRVMDPLSQKTMAIRTDMTPQIGRIAATLLRDLPRPLRLCYGGQTLRTTPEALDTRRQFRQVGIELIGAGGLLADVEVMQTAIAAVQSLGFADLSLDLNLPPLLGHFTALLPAEQHPGLIAALRAKDSTAIAAYRLPFLAEIAAISGPAAAALAQLRAMALPDALRAPCALLEEACALLKARLGGALALTIDPLDVQGFGAYTGLRFSLFLRSQRREIGRGGRYTAPSGEPAAGFTLYSEDLLPFIAPLEPLPRLLLPPHVTEASAAALRAEGYVTLYATSERMEQEAATVNARVYKE